MVGVRGIVGVLLVTGCIPTTGPGPLDYGPPPPGPCDSPDAAVPDGPPSTRLYVINVLSLPSPSLDGTHIDGFDLDGTTATVCGQADYDASLFLCAGPSTLDAMGVDNALSGFFGPVANDSIQRGTDNASLPLIILRVEDINSFIDDPSVTLTAYVGRLPARASPAHLGPCPTESSTDPNCRLAAGQAFDIDSSSFLDGLAGMMPRTRFSSASIINGRLQASVVEFPLTASFMDTPVPLTLLGARLSFGITDTAIDLGVLGGALRNTDLLASLAAAPAICSYVPTLQPILAMYSDLMPIAVGPCASPDGGFGGNRCPSGAACDMATHMCTSCSEASIAFDVAGVAAVEGAIVTTPTMDAGVSGCSYDAGGD